jgi:hypothetical protein
VVSRLSVFRRHRRRHGFHRRRCWHHHLRILRRRLSCRLRIRRHRHLLSGLSHLNYSCRHLKNEWLSLMSGLSCLNCSCLMNGCLSRLMSGLSCLNCSYLMNGCLNRLSETLNLKSGCCLMSLKLSLKSGWLKSRCSLQSKTCVSLKWSLSLFRQTW